MQALGSPFPAPCVLPTLGRAEKCSSHLGNHNVMGCYAQEQRSSLVILCKTSGWMNIWVTEGKTEFPLLFPLLFSTAAARTGLSSQPAAAAWLASVRAAGTEVDQIRSLCLHSSAASSRNGTGKESALGYLLRSCIQTSPS